MQFSCKDCIFMLLYKQGDDMKVLLYVNQEKIIDGSLNQAIISACEKIGVDYQIVEKTDLSKNIYADAFVCVGGDGTILSTAQFAGENNIPILGINAGKVGFLTEFEGDEIEKALTELVSGNLKVDERINMEVTFKGEKYHALNDVVIQRIYRENVSRMILNVKVDIDGNFVDQIAGDGIIVSTPTGSTAYSLSAGGAILAPGIQAFSMTPLSAHSLHNRPVIFSADSVCEAEIVGEVSACVFLDGKLIGVLDEGEKISIKKAKYNTVFLRKNDSNFYNRLIEKLKRNK